MISRLQALAGLPLITLSLALPHSKVHEYAAKNPTEAGWSWILKTKPQAIIPLKTPEIAEQTPLEPIDIAPQQNAMSYNMATTPSIIPGCGDNSYANFIYMHESGCNLNAVNSIGCRGIGQACPGTKLPCGADYVCQNAWFTAYAYSAYGGWAGAYSFWIGHSWW